MTNLTHLARHWFNQTAKGKGIDLSAEDLALIDTTEAGKLIRLLAIDDGSDPAIPHACSCCDPFVYLIQATDGGAIKIGTSGNPAQRRTEHQTGNPSELVIIAQFRAPQRVERQLQAHFRPEWIRGEWFYPSPRLLRFAERYRS